MAFPIVGQPFSSQTQFDTLTLDQIGLPTNYVAATNTSAFTATATQIFNANDNTLKLTGTLGAGAAITMPTAAALLATMSAPYVNFSFNLRIINQQSGAFAWTVTTSTGNTLLGTQTIAQNTFRDYYVTITNVTTAAVTYQEVGTGTAS